MCRLEDSSHDDVGAVSYLYDVSMFELPSCLIASFGKL